MVSMRKIRRQQNQCRRWGGRTQMPDEQIREFFQAPDRGGELDYPEDDWDDQYDWSGGGIPASQTGLTFTRQPRDYR